MRTRTLPAGEAGRVLIRCTDRHDGDFHVDGAQPGLSERRAVVAAGPWTWLRQVHGADVVAVDAAGDGAGTEADASFTTTPGAVLAVQTADCAPVVIVGRGIVGVAHAGWRGVVAGVVPALVAAMRAEVDTPLTAILGPCIRPHAYAFGGEDLASVVEVAGADAAGVTADGGPALDMGAAIAGVLGAVDVPLDDMGLDTASPDYFSHRCRRDPERQVTVAWLEQR